MSGPKRTLLAILLFVALVLGSFIWFIATWGDRAEAGAAPIVLAENIFGFETGTGNLDTVPNA